VHFNRVCQELTGYSLEEVKGRLVRDFLLVPEEAERVKEAFREVLGGTPNRYENHWVTKDGRHVLLSWSNSVSLSGGAVEYVIATAIDITGRREAEERARASEATVRALLEAATHAILAVDRNGRVVLANAAAEEMFGYGRQELIGQPVGKLLPERFAAKHEANMAEWFLHPVSRPMGGEVEFACLHKDGSEFPTEISLSSIESRDGTLGVAFISDITVRKNTAATLEAYRQQLQHLTASLISTQEGENRALARELHDVFTQELAAASMEISALVQSSSGRTGPFRNRLAALGKKIAMLADEIHGKSRRLHPVILEDLGLKAALREECRSMQEHSRIPVEFALENVPASVPEEVSLCLYRVAQESLRNIGKHSKATQVHMALTGGQSGITLRIEDKGEGFDLDQEVKKGGLGFVSMEERVRLVGGTLTIQSQLGKGTTVTAFVPLSGELA